MLSGDEILEKLQIYRSSVDLSADDIAAEFQLLAQLVAASDDVLELKRRLDAVVRENGKESSDYKILFEQLGVLCLKHIRNYFASKGIVEPLYAKFYLLFATSDLLQGRPNPITDADLMASLKPKLKFARNEPVRLG